MASKSRRRETIPSNLLSKWRKWINGLPKLERLYIPRCYRQCSILKVNALQLHIFVDAGRDGYTAVGYFRYEQDEVIEVSLVGAKTRVTPLEYVSIPRLELQAAHLGS